MPLNKTCEAPDTLFDVVGRAISNLECSDVQCWCFTRAAMKGQQCDYANCDVWRSLTKALDAQRVLAAKSSPITE
jgi:hypothetical protein